MRLKRLIPFVGLLSLLGGVLTGCGSPAAPEITAFDVTPQALHVGDDAVLTWKTLNAVSVVVTRDDGEPVDLAGQPAGSGSLTVPFTAPGEVTFTLTATGEPDTSPAAATRTVSVTWAPAEVVTFQANPGTVRAGGSSLLTWEVAEAVSVSLKTQAGDDVPLADAGVPSGSVEVNPPDTTTYVLEVQGQDTTDTAEATVTVNHPAAILSFGSSPTGAVRAGEPVVLSWSTAHASGVEIKDDLGSTVITSTDASGEVTVHPDVSRTYSLVASGPHGDATADLLVHVTAVIDAFAVDETVVREGDVVTLSWRTSGGTEFAIEGPDGFRHTPPQAEWAEGSTDVTIQGGGLFVLSVTSSWNVFSETLEVRKTTAPRIRELTVAPEQVTEGETVTATWRVDGAEQLTLKVNGEDVPVPADSLDAGSTSFVLVTPGPAAVTLTASNSVDPADTSHTLQAAVDVLAIPIVDSFHALPSAVPAGGTAELAWRTTHAARVWIEKDGALMDLGELELDGSRTDLVAADATYVFHAENALGAASAPVEATIRIGDPAISTFEVQPARVAPSQPVTFMWAVEGGSRLSITDETGNTVYETQDLAAIHGGSWRPDAPVDMDEYTYTLVVEDQLGTRTEALVTLDVMDGPSIELFEADPVRATVGDEIVLSWVVANDVYGDSPVLSLTDQDGDDYDISEKDPNADTLSIAASSAGTWTYTLTASTGRTDDTRAIEVQVVAAPKVLAFTPAPLYLTTEGGTQNPSTNLAWKVESAVEIKIAKDTGNGAFVDLATITDPTQMAEGSYEVFPEGTVFYRLEAINATGATDFAFAKVYVDAPRILSFEALDGTGVPVTQVLVNGTVTLSWQVEDADHILVSPIVPSSTTILDSRFEDISGTGHPVALTSRLEKGYGLIDFPLDFGFPWEGQERRQVKVTNAGYLGFDLGEAVDDYNDGIPYSSAPNGGFLAPFWERMRPNDEGGIYWEKRTHADRGDYVIVQWSNYDTYESYGTKRNSNLNFQIVLWEDGGIEYRYGTMTCTLDDGSSCQSYADADDATIGLEFSGGSIGLQISKNTPVAGGLSNRTYEIDMAVDPTKTANIKLSKSTVFYLTAVNENGAVGQTLPVDVISPASVTTSTPSPSAPEAGVPFDFKFTVKYTQSVTVTRTFGGETVVLCAGEHDPTRSSISLSCPDTVTEAGTYSYKVDVVGPLNTASATRSITVKPELRLDSFTVNGGSQVLIASGETAELAWTTTGAGEVVLLENGVRRTEVLPVNGSLQVAPTVSTIYELQAKLDSRKRTAEVQVFLNPAKVDAVTSDVAYLPPGGGNVTVSWETSGADSVTVLPTHQITYENEFRSLYANPAGRDVTPNSSFSDATIQVDTLGVFEFPFQGQTFTQFGMTTNGFVALGPDRLDTFADNYYIPTTKTEGFFAPFWDDLKRSEHTRFFYAVSGRAPNRTLTFEWYRVNGNYGSDWITFQLVLHENGDAEFRYLDVSGDSSYVNGRYVNIGWQGFGADAPYGVVLNQSAKPELLAPGTRHMFYLGMAGASGSRTFSGVNADTTFKVCATRYEPLEEVPEYTDCQDVTVHVLKPGEVGFTELMVDPQTQDGEFVELRSYSDRPLDLAGWTLTNGQPDGTYTLPTDAPLILEPKGFLVLGRSADTAVNGGYTPDLAYGTAAPGLVLEQPAGKVALQLAGVSVDEVAWDTAEGWTIPNGASLSLDASFFVKIDGAINDHFSDVGGAIWCVSSADEVFGTGTALGSPGDRGEGCRIFGGHYTFAPDEGEWIEISSTGTLLAGTEVTGGLQEVSGGLGFDMPFFGSVVNAFWVSQRGFLSFLPLDPALESVYRMNRDIPNAQYAPDGFLAPYWDELNVRADGTSHVYVDRQVVDGHQVAIVQWSDMQVLSTAGWATFQAQLWDNGEIYFLYGRLEPEGEDRYSHYAAANADIGLEDVDGSRGVHYTSGYSVRISTDTRLHFTHRP